MFLLITPPSAPYLLELLELSPLCYYFSTYFLFERSQFQQFTQRSMPKLSVVLMILWCLSTIFINTQWTQFTLIWSRVMPQYWWGDFLTQIFHPVIYMFLLTPSPLPHIRSFMSTIFCVWKCPAPFRNITYKMPHRKIKVSKDIKIELFWFIFSIIFLTFHSCPSIIFFRKRDVDDLVERGAEKCGRTRYCYEHCCGYFGQCCKKGWRCKYVYQIRSFICSPWRKRRKQILSDCHYICFYKDTYILGFAYGLPGAGIPDTAEPMSIGNYNIIGSTLSKMGSKK